MNNTSLNNPFQLSNLQIDWNAGVTAPDGFVAPVSGICYFFADNINGIDGQAEADGKIIMHSGSLSRHNQGSIALICKHNKITHSANIGAVFYPFK